jgi:hypothetical protein
VESAPPVVLLIVPVKTAAMMVVAAPVVPVLEDRSAIAEFAKIHQPVAVLQSAALALTAEAHPAGLTTME